jgi:hypothetical protein
MEHFEGQWQVKPVSYKGTSKCWAFVEGWGSLESCASRQWTLLNSEGAWTNSPLMKVMTEVDAKAAAEAKAAANAKAAAEAKISAENARAVPMLISGATGKFADRVNGCFDSTQETGADGRVLYRKRGDASVCMEHFEGKWSIKSEAEIDTSNCWAYVKGGCALEDCTSRQWTLSDGTGKGVWTNPPLMKVMTEAEAKAATNAKAAAESKASPEIEYAIEVKKLLVLKSFAALRIYLWYLKRRRLRPAKFSAKSLHDFKVLLCEAELKFPYSFRKYY